MHTEEQDQDQELSSEYSAADVTTFLSTFEVLTNYHYLDYFYDIFIVTFQKHYMQLSVSFPLYQDILLEATSLFMLVNSYTSISL